MADCRFGLAPAFPFRAALLSLLIIAVGGCEQEQEQVQETEGSRVALTPPTPATPRINGPKIFGVRPGAPFLFQIPATGERPMRFSAAGLPDGLSLDQASGQITGTVAARGRQAVTLRAENGRGVAERAFTIVVGDEIALTPPMGWNSWNVWGGTVSQEKVLAAARVLVSSGLRDHGWTYVNIDDGWQGKRGGEFKAIQPNPNFPDLPALANEIHSLGLKLGIYSSPWRTTFNFHIGSTADTPDGRYTWQESGSHDQFFRYQFPMDDPGPRWFGPLARWRKNRWHKRITEDMRRFGAHSFVRQDVAQWAAWGVDYLKYDWMPTDVAHTEEMRQALAACGRDIIYSIANNTRFAVAPEIAPLVNSWRTSRDLHDKWYDVTELGFTRDRWAKLQRPGRFNDADMLVLGHLGWGQPRPSKLTADEQFTHMSLWCLLGGPLLLGCDLEKLDEFTLGLITNDEVLEIDQDSLGKQAVRIAGDRKTDVFVKPLDDNSCAVGLFNRDTTPRRVRVAWKNLGRTRPQMVRDLWRQKALGTFDDGFEAEVAPHGVVLLRVADRQD